MPQNQGIFMSLAISRGECFEETQTRVSFLVEEKSKSISACIETNRLCLKSIKSSEKYYDYYASLFGDQDVMSMYATGETKTREDMKTRIDNLWAKRWKEGDPYSGFAVFKKDTKEFIGHVAIGHGNAPGEAAIGYLFMKNYWRQGYGSEAVNAVVKDYAPEVVKRGYSVEGAPLNKIVATTKPDNIASGKILQKVGMHLVGQAEEYGSMRDCYSIDV